MASKYNNARSTLAAPFTSSGTSFVCKTWEGGIFPPWQNDYTIEKIVSWVVTRRDVVKATRSGDVFAVNERNSQSCVQSDAADPKTRTSNPNNFDTGDFISLRVTEEDWDDVYNQINNLETDKLDHTWWSIKKLDYKETDWLAIPWTAWTCIWTFVWNASSRIQIEYVWWSSFDAWNSQRDTFAVSWKIVLSIGNWLNIKNIFWYWIQDNNNASPFNNFRVVKGANINTWIIWVYGGIWINSTFFKISHSCISFTPLFTSWSAPNIDEPNGIYEISRSYYYPWVIYAENVPQYTDNRIVSNANSAVWSGFFGATPSTTNTPYADYWKIFNLYENASYWQQYAIKGNGEKWERSIAGWIFWNWLKTWFASEVYLKPSSSRIFFQELTERSSTQNGSVWVVMKQIRVPTNIKNGSRVTVRYGAREWTPTAGNTNARVYVSNNTSLWTAAGTQNSVSLTSYTTYTDNAVVVNAGQYIQLAMMCTDSSGQTLWADDLEILCDIEFWTPMAWTFTPIS